MMHPRRFVLADRPEDFQRLGLNPDAVAPWEDGQRISTEPGKLEWWYFDAHLSDGTVIVVVFTDARHSSLAAASFHRFPLTSIYPTGAQF
jgi:hypothetical protein